MFKDRTQAGQQLARKLERYHGTDAVVLAIPRGGVVLGYEVSRALSLPLDIIVTRKIGHPSSPEYAIGVVDESGMNIFNTGEVDSVDRQWLREEIAAQREEAKRRSTLYRKGRKPLRLLDKVIIIVDDGIATGYTMQLAVRIAKQQQPRKVIVAVPVAAAESVSLLAREADEVIVLEPPEMFLGAIGSHYEEFGQVGDDEVVGVLSDAAAEKE